MFGCVFFLKKELGIHDIMDCICETIVNSVLLYFLKEF